MRPVRDRVRRAKPSRWVGGWTTADYQPWFHFSSAYWRPENVDMTASLYRRDGGLLVARVLRSRPRGVLRRRVVEGSLWAGYRPLESPIDAVHGLIAGTGSVRRGRAL